MEFVQSVKICSIALLASLLCAPTASADSGFFIGGSIGDAALSFDDVDFSGNSFDNNDTAWKGYIGYIFDLPVVDFGVEAAYVDFGAPSDISVFDQQVEVDVTGITAFGTVGIDWGLFGAFAKAGVVSWDAKFAIDNLGLGSEDGSDAAYGIGFRFNFSSLEVRAEFEKFDVDEADVDMASVGVLWRF